VFTVSSYMDKSVGTPDHYTKSHCAILNGDESIGAVLLHAGENDIRLRQTEVLKQDFRSLIERVK